MAEITTPSYTIRYATEHDIPQILQMIQELASYERALHEVLATQEKLFNTLSFPTSTDEKVRSKPGFARTLLIIPRGDVGGSTGSGSGLGSTSTGSTVAQDAAARVEVETSSNTVSGSSVDEKDQVAEAGVGSSSPSTAAQIASAKLESETSANAGLPPTTSSPKSEKVPIAGMALFFNNYSTWLAKPGIYLEDLFVRPAYRKRGYGKALLQALARECVKNDFGRLEWSVLSWNKPSIDFYESETIGAVSSREEWEGMRVTGEALGRLAGGKVA